METAQFKGTGPFLFAAIGIYLASVIGQCNRLAIQRRTAEQVGARQRFAEAKPL
jgi:transcription initiation factor TFIIIB Brf1 subunit/transcription initiation factor TFIIB